MKNNQDRSYIYKIALTSSMVNDARILASKYIPKGASVLDVGCACGDFGDFLHKTKDVQVHGFEYDAKSIEIAKSSNIYKSISQVDLNSFNPETHPELHGHFDIIALIDVLEHTINPLDVIEKLKPLLNDTGSFVISLPNASFGEVKAKILRDNFEYTDMGIMDRTHLRFYTFRTMAALFADSNLSINESSVTVALFDEHLIGLPCAIKRNIRKNPKSHVFQYIFKATPTSATKSAVLHRNIASLDIDWNFIKEPLRIISGNPFINFFLPRQSRRKKLVKKIATRLRGEQRVS